MASREGHANEPPCMEGGASPLVVFHDTALLERPQIEVQVRKPRNSLPDSIYDVHLGSPNVALDAPDATTFRLPFQIFNDESSVGKLRMYDTAAGKEISTTTDIATEIGTRARSSIVAKLSSQNHRASVAIIASGILGKDMAENADDNLESSYLEANAIAERIHIVLTSLFILAMSGIILMIIENEILFNNRNQATWVTTRIKISLSVSTILAEYCLISYYTLSFKRMKLRGFMIPGGPAMSNARYFQLFVEICILAIHPLPWLDGSFELYNGWSSKILEFKSIYTYDAFLGILMFSRLYLIGRLFLYASSLHLRTAEVIAKINKVDLNPWFALKSILDQTPILFLITALVVNILVSSYCLNACERSSPSPEVSNFAEALWFMYVTVATLGYGELVITTYCARSIAMMGSVVGFVTTALIIMVAKQAVVLSSAQARVLFILEKEKWKKDLKLKAVISVQRIWRMRHYSLNSVVHRLQVYSALHDWRLTRRRYRQFIDRHRGTADVCFVFNHPNSTASFV
eukprot:TRINITY_DN7273_c0_g2_i9.p1 TRINITY_DN7273_c0_g2~~TRINITY_DN7273_c0_g2_i9.p1  ORF type:complete len:519 (+),score=78.06 TRINITY_DN7273_c0_g2_i9:110-1666(+)